MNTNILFIFLYIFLSLLSVSLITFIVVFLTQRLVLYKLYKLMVRFNHYNDNPIASNLNHIAYLVEKNEELQPLYKFFSNLNKTYTEQMQVIKKQIFDLSNYTKNFHLIKVWKYLKIIENNLNIIKNEENSYRILNFDTNQYTNNTSSIAVKLSEIMNNLNSFIRDNNIKTEFYKSNNCLEEVIEIIEKTTKDINENLMKIDNVSAHKSFLNAILNIEKLYILVDDYYQIYRYQILVKSLSLNLKNVIDENKDSIFSESLWESIQKILSTSNKKITSSNKALWNKDFNATKLILSDLIINMDKCITNIKREVKFKKLLDKHFDEFKLLLKDFLNKYDSNATTMIYNRINEDFKYNAEISDLLVLCVKDIDEIFTDIKKCKEVLKDKKIYSIEIIETIINIYKKIEFFLNKNIDLRKMLLLEMENYYSAVYSIDNEIVGLNYLLYTIDTNNLKVKEIKHDIGNYILTLREYQNKLLNSKKVEDKCIKDLRNIETFIERNSDEISNFLILKNIAQKLLLYFNQYIDIEQETINKCSAMIDNGEYKDAIDELVDFSNRIKKAKKGARNAI